MERGKRNAESLKMIYVDFKANRTVGETEIYMWDIG